MAKVIYEDLHATVTDLLAKHISRDFTLVDADKKWETDNFVRALADELRLGLPDILNVSPEPKPPPMRDLSEFEGM